MLRTIFYWLIPIVFFLGWGGGCTTQSERFPPVIPVNDTVPSSQTPSSAAPHKTKEKLAIERNRLNSNFKRAQPLISRLSQSLDHHITWNQLQQLIQKTQQNTKLSPKTTQAANYVLKYLRFKGFQLSSIYDFPFEWQGKDKVILKNLKSYRHIQAAPGLISMWQHCKQKLKRRYPKINVSIVSAYQSPAYQAVMLFKSGSSLKQALKKTPAPYYSKHQGKLPDATVRFGKKSIRTTVRTFDQACKEYGFLPRSAKHINVLKEYRFVGIEWMYEKILKSGRFTDKDIPSILSQAMKNTGFYPSPNGLRIIIALAEKESGLRWNPTVSNIKKKELRKRFQKVLFKAEEGFTGYLANVLLSKQQKIQKKALAEELIYITDLKNRSVTEYDIYRWSRKTLSFFQGILQSHKDLVKFGQLIINIRSLETKLKHEPQTFGLWQNNVNFLVEKLATSKRFRSRYARLFYRGKVNRNYLVRALCGIKRPLTRLKTMEMILQVIIIPRYYSHFLGEKNDWLYFAAENLSGEMSTYRAAIQSELNRREKTSLSLDGDLAVYHPYSTRINWKIQSNTQITLKGYLVKAIGSNWDQQSITQMIRSICNANSIKSLMKSKAYRLLMKNRLGNRILPIVESKLYGQSPKQYATKVLTLASKYILRL